MNTSKRDVPRTSLSSKITSHRSFHLMKWLVIIVLLVLLLLAIFLPDRGLANPAVGTSAYQITAQAKLADEHQRRRSRFPGSALGDDPSNRFQHAFGKTYAHMVAVDFEGYGHTRVVVVF